MVSSPACDAFRVSIIGAGNVGSTLAQRVAEKNIADVVLLDVVSGRPQGVALDLMQARGVERHDRKIIGTIDYTDTTNSQIVVITAGLPRRPGMSRDDLLLTNAKIVRATVKQAYQASPNAIFIVVTNPLDVMTYLAWQESQLPGHRIMGMGGVLDSARFQTFIAMELGVSICDVQALVLGGHGDLMVPLPRYSTVSGVPLPELLSQDTIERLIDRTRNGGAEIVGLLQTGGAYYAPASAVCTMIEAILRNQSRWLPIAARLQGEYGLNDIVIGVPCRLGCNGIEQILELQLTNAEREALQQSAASVRQSIDRVNELNPDRLT